MHDMDKYMRKQRKKKAAIILAAHRRAKAAARYAEMHMNDVRENAQENVSKGIDKHGDV